MEMREVEISTLEWPALDWAVAAAIGAKPEFANPIFGFYISTHPECTGGVIPASGYPFSPSLKWAQVGPMMESYSPIFTICRGQVRAEILHGVGFGENYRAAFCRAVVDAHSATGTVMVPVDLVGPKP